jgi:hypothetical protein
MPGLIDAHWHAMMAAMPMQNLISSEVADINFAAAQESENTLMRGFTSVRDLSGPTFSLKRAIDSNIVNGPRIWPSGAMISQTGGHGDFRMTYEIPLHGNTFIIMNDHICQLMVNHLNLNNYKDFGFLLIKSIKNGGITLVYKSFHLFQLDLRLII